MPAFLDSIPQELAKHIVPHLTDKSAGLAGLPEHSQHITGRTAGTGFKQTVALIADAVFRKVNQKLAQSDNIKFFCHGLYLQIVFFHIHQHSSITGEADRFRLQRGINDSGCCLLAVVDKDLKAVTIHNQP